MSEKYIVTVETPKGIEVICRPRDGPFISSSGHGEAEGWANKKAGEFPGFKYNIYKLEFIISTTYQKE